MVAVPVWIPISSSDDRFSSSVSLLEIPQGPLLLLPQNLDISLGTEVSIFSFLFLFAFNSSCFQHCCRQLPLCLWWRLCCCFMDTYINLGWFITRSVCTVNSHNIFTSSFSLQGYVRTTCYLLSLGRTREGGWISLRIRKVFLSFLLEDKTSAPDIFSSFSFIP